MKISMSLPNDGSLGVEITTPLDSIVFRARTPPRGSLDVLVASLIGIMSGHARIEPVRWSLWPDEVVFSFEPVDGADSLRRFKVEYIDRHLPVGLQTPTLRISAEIAGLDLVKKFWRALRRIQTEAARIQRDGRSVDWDALPDTAMETLTRLIRNGNET